jgi:hypothetical protein
VLTSITRTAVEVSTLEAMRTQGRFSLFLGIVHAISVVLPFNPELGLTYSG